MKTGPLAVQSRRSGIIIAVAVALFSIAIIIFQFFYIGIQLRIQEEERSKEIASLTSQEIANSVEVYFRDALTVTQTYSRNFLVYRQNQLPRSTIDSLIRGTLALSDNFLAIWTLWEPNAYDSKDHYFRNDSNHDPKGTFAISYYYQDNSIRRELNDSSDIYEDYYKIPKSYKQPVILDPYYYQYHGNSKIYYETSLVSPIILEDKFLGVIGIDIDMYSLQAKYNKTKVYKDGYISILSNSGNIVTHKFPQYIEKNISDYTQNENTEILDSLKTSREFTTESYSMFTGEKVIRYYFPVNIKYMAAPWYIMIEIPLSDVFRNTNSLKLISTTLLLASLLLLSYLIYNIIDRRSKENAILATLLKVEQSESRLKETELELKRYQVHLEEIVNERTGEVQKLNKKLTFANNELFGINEQILQQKEELGVTLDQLKQVQEKLIISEKMASLGLFTAGIAHEINNPVNFISAGTSTLFEKLDNLKKSEVADNKEFIKFFTDVDIFRNAISTGIARITEIIMSLRNYSGSNSEVFISYNPERCIKDALIILNNKFKHRITIIEDYDTERVIDCIPGKLNQVFVNLLSNAIDAIPEKGKIFISTKYRDHVFEVEIRDNGIGIKADSISSLFDPFYTTKDIGKGVGLGLYIVYGIIDQHKGKIDIKSEEGKGTSFTILLPVRKV
jgi:signal transduction histidine kinase